MLLRLARPSIFGDRDRAIRTFSEDSAQIPLLTEWATLRSALMVVFGYHCTTTFTTWRLLTPTAASRSVIACRRVKFTVAKISARARAVNPRRRRPLKSAAAARRPATVVVRRVYLCSSPRIYPRIVDGGWQDHGGRY